jgi:putative ubiquitin-RnfH superfamily antitoxin RatB of RatAB toxin-antitoxin module
MRVNSESVSNKIDESELQYAKQPGQRIWICRGIVIDLREEQRQKVFDSMCVNLEPDSNKTDEREWQDAKQSEQRIWTWREILIDLKEKQR